MQVERLTASLPADQAKALLASATQHQGKEEEEDEEEERKEGAQSRQAWRQQDVEAFLAQLMEVGRSLGRCKATATEGQLTAGRGAGVL